ncbi:hypothetical protein CEXT_778421 [Caerostris extrusa]|uniref:Uncharacterized protein n=1 Tax=Caerostris extrusa TaxID=172846 RepID=A0AAV4X3A4_CAEEX|nr:hypothetical protein CEXT_778421 [Caerostris extrusa]
MASSTETPKASDEYIVSKLVLRRVTKENNIEVSIDNDEFFLTSHPLDLQTIPIFSYDENSQMTTIESLRVQRTSVSDQYVVSKLIFRRVRKENAVEASSDSDESTLSTPVSSGDEFSCDTTDESSSSGSAGLSAAVSSYRQPKKKCSISPHLVPHPSLIHLERSTYVAYVAGLFVNIEFLKRHVEIHPKNLLINVHYVIRHFFCPPKGKSTNAYIPEKSHLNAKFARNAFQLVLTCQFTTRHILESNHMNVMFAGRRS